MGEEITAEAKKKSEEMLRKADTDAREQQTEMKNKFSQEQERLKSIKAETIKYIKASQEILRQHSQFLTKLEDVNSEIVVTQTQNEPEPIYEEQPEQTPVSEFDETVEEIDNALFGITDPEADPFAKVFKSEEPEKDNKLSFKEDDEEEVDEPTSPRPKFDFTNLKFGTNYTGE